MEKDVEMNETENGPYGSKDCTNCALIDTGKCPLDRQRKQSSLIVCDKWVGELKREIVFWAVAPGEDELTHETVDEAVEDFIDRWPHEARSPESVEVIGYARRVVEDDGMGSLESMLYHLDEELGDPKGDYTTPTPRMVEAAAAFAKVVCSEYVSWQCEEVTRQTVDVREWIRKHHPEWLEAREADVMERLATTFGPRK